MSSRLKKAVFLFGMIFSTVTISAQTMKIASIIPPGSIWDEYLREMVGEWETISKGKIKSQIYLGGSVGGEVEIVRGMRIGQIHAAVLTSQGLGAIVSDTMAFSTPFLIRDDKELEYVLNDVAPQLFDSQFEAEGFRILSWSHSGWVSFFTKEPMKEPDQLRRMKLAGPDGKLSQTWRDVGFRVVSSDLSDLMIGLQSGSIEAVIAPPMAAAALQWYSIAPYMLDIDVAPLIGGFVITERMWRRIPDEFKKEIQDSIDRTVIKFYTGFNKTNDDAINTMTRYGLKRTTATEQQRDKWISLFKEYQELLKNQNSLIKASVFDQIEAKMEEFRDLN